MDSIMRRTRKIFLWVALLCGPTAALAIPNPYAWDVVGFATDAGGSPVLHGTVTARIYDAPGPEGNLITTCGSTITGGLFEIPIGMSPPLMLDDVITYHFELDVDGDEVIGDANGTRLPFRPGGGDHSRPDLEARLDSLEAVLGVAKAAPAAQTSRSEAKATANYAELAGVLGIGHMEGATSAYAVGADMLLQPVGIFTSSLHRVELGPFHIPSAGIAAGVETMLPPARWALYSCEPNPFSASTRIRFDVPPGGGVAGLRIFDLSGRLVRTLAYGERQPGRHVVVWRGDDDHGRLMGSGVYVCQMRASGYGQARRLILIR